jgi:hypothetical protein
MLALPQKRETTEYTENTEKGRGQRRRAKKKGRTAVRPFSLSFVFFFRVFRVFRGFPCL